MWIKPMTGLFAAVVCVGVIATIGIFLPSQTIQQQATENKTWHEKLVFYGTNNENRMIQIDSEIWRIEWIALPLQGRENISLFAMDVYSRPDGYLITTGSLNKGWPVADTRYIVQKGQFEVTITTANLEGWQINIYEYY